MPATGAKRPSSVVSDSPSLLFGGVDNDDSGPSARMSRSPSYQAGLLPAGSVDDSLFPRRNPQARPPLPTSSSRRRVTSLYGQPSSNTSAIHGQGSTATAYGHVSSTGIFDPTASLRHSQHNRRRRRADSNASASMATGAGTSIYSTQPIADADEKAYYDLPEGHAPGDIVVLGGEAQEKLRGSIEQTHSPAETGTAERRMRAVSKRKNVTRREPKPGYCENCRDKYEDFSEVRRFPRMCCAALLTSPTISKARNIEDSPST